MTKGVKSLPPKKGEGGYYQQTMQQFFVHTNDPPPPLPKTQGNNDVLKQTIDDVERES